MNTYIHTCTPTWWKGEQPSNRLPCEAMPSVVKALPKNHLGCDARWTGSPLTPKTTGRHRRTFLQDEYTKKVETSCKYLIVSKHMREEKRRYT